MLEEIIDADLGQQDLLLRFQYSNTHTHGLQKSCGEKGAAWPLSKLKRGPLYPHLDRLLLFFWAHYIEGHPHLLCAGSPQVITF